ncbi:V4R domain-containing protein [Tuwongella immobilis]|uniref:4-vinyl reductase 4VR domain-containing protein n=1 Tax=Tuwongella immobilis TaxID=692036 RepID=A0A6C2YQ53_9BACT|nr:V4R domain-containing protein [Tuwongella immobilis]VIP03524.1 4-vinyl reductase 4VR OS=Isosphaera pallida (strain ATCC 43644 / DSM 9630 / IS1B) GN=Isop_2218 PE=4 SV=1: V4R [Tuwongella immobilis]VTS04416.1 4-vinyl reductase 4VR OS=Isosphaera pallida (strain ATCC 43644 / DSM 9630 / IS1B) GN=Isop_2218 PE=4 SV=1: V4R [Tuwongella immobilis]
MTGLPVDGALQRGNYFSEKQFIKTEPRRGVSRNRSGTRIVSLTTDFLAGLRTAMVQECGPAASLVLHSCGRNWGKMFAKRLEKELSEFYGQPLRESPMIFFQSCLMEAFSHHGWGKIAIDYAWIQHGVIVVTVENPPYAGMVPDANEPVESLLAGILGGVFSHFSGEDLNCLQTDCQQCGAEVDRFVIGLSPRIEKVSEMKGKGASYNQILDELKRART